MVIGINDHLREFAELVKRANPGADVYTYLDGGPLISSMPAEYVHDTTMTFLFAARSATRIYFNLRGFDPQRALRDQGGGGFTSEEFWLLQLPHQDSLHRKTVYFDFVRPTLPNGSRLETYMPNLTWTSRELGPLRSYFERW